MYKHFILNPRESCKKQGSSLRSEREVSNVLEIPHPPRRIRNDIVCENIFTHFFYINLFLFLFPSILLLSCSSPKISILNIEVEHQPSIRVLITEKQSRVQVGLQSGATILLDDKKYNAAKPEKLELHSNYDGSMKVIISNIVFQPSTNSVKCFYKRDAALFDYQGRQYPDTLFFISNGKDIDAINILALEKYLTGVLPNEIGKDRKEIDFEAIKAQSIAARTYAISKIAAPTKRSYDVYDDSRDQVFTGITSQSPIITLAVQQTAGKILMFGESIAECYFHSTCGGRTEAPQLVWNRPQGKSYLNGIEDSDDGTPNCKISPSYRWRETYSREQLEKIIKKNLGIANKEYAKENFPNNWYLLNVLITKRLPSGRVSELKIILGNQSQQKSYTIDNNQVRWVLRKLDNNDVLPSNLIEIQIVRDENKWIKSVIIKGGGNGHGVGMCQWGAIGLARKGKSAAYILHKYFPGTEIVTVY